MSQKFIAKVTNEHNLEIPPEIKPQLEPKSEYEVILNKDEIIFKRIKLPNLRHGSGKSFLRHSGTWQGDDFEESLQAVYDNRSQVKV
jgi:bifunctional DNA-binding transcriptional regulator/antitoxin component of YhaV-PrlF toxin-antitoxin module